MSSLAAKLRYPKLEHDDRILLPLDARYMLQSAARHEAEKIAGESKKRSDAIDDTVKELRKLYPSAFWPLNKLGFAIRHG